MRLDEAIDSIMAAAKQRLERAIAPAGLLEGIEEVVRGDRARPKPLTPCIWMFAEMAQCSDRTFGLQETWELPVVLAPVVKNDEPEEGYKQASAFAAKARSAIFTDELGQPDRTLGLRSLVQDVKSGRFEPSGPAHRDGSLFGAAAVVMVRFRILE